MRKQIRITAVVLMVLCLLPAPLRVLSQGVQKLTPVSIIATNSALFGQSNGPQKLFDGAKSDIETDGWFEEGTNLWIAFDIGKESSLSTLKLWHLGGFKPFNTASYSFYVLDERKITTERLLSLSFAERNALLSRSEYWKCLVSVSGNTESVTSHSLSQSTGRIFKFLVSEPDSYDTNDHVIRVFELELTGTPIEAAADKAALQTAVEDARMREEEHYTPLSWEAFADALAAAIDVLNRPDAVQIEVDTAESALIRAEAALVIRADTAELRAMVGELKALKESDYTAETFGELGLLLQEADALLADANALQSECDAMMRTLQQKRGALVKTEKPEESSAESSEASKEEPPKAEPEPEETPDPSPSREESALENSMPEESAVTEAPEESKEQPERAKEEENPSNPLILSTVLLLAGGGCFAAALLRRKKRKG